LSERCAPDVLSEAKDPCNDEADLVGGTGSFVATLVAYGSFAALRMTPCADDHARERT